MLFVALLVASLLAFLVSSVAGGGAGLILLPLLALALPAAQAPAALSIGTAASSLSRIGLMRGHIRWDVVRWFAPAALPGAAAGAWLLSRFDPVYVQLGLGLFLAANLPLVLRRNPAMPPPLPADRVPRQLVTIGLAAGLLSGFTGAVGVLFNRFYLRLGLAKQEIVATRAANELLVHLLKLGVYTRLGLLAPRAWLAGLVVAAGALLASVVAARHLQRVDDRLFRRLNVAAMVGAGIAMTTTAGAQVMVRNDAGVAYEVSSHEFEMTAIWRGQRVAVELDRLEGLVVMRRVNPADIPAAERARLLALTGGGTLVSIDAETSLVQAGWDVRFVRDGRQFEVDAPRGDN